MEETIQKTQEVQFTVHKVDDELGIAFGYAIICKKDGEDYFDLHGDHIPEKVMLKAASEFAAGYMPAHDMHIDEYAGQILFSFPMTEDIAKSLGIKTKTTGLLIGMKPDKRMLKAMKDGKYTGFSIGFRVYEKDLEEVENV
jgi:hypothetical protein